jgi:acyl carrier protein
MNSTRDTVRAVVQRYFADDLAGRPLSADDDADLAASGLHIDSLGRMGLFVELEQAFRVELREQDLRPEAVSSIAAMSALMDRYRAPGTVT